MTEEINTVMPETANETTEQEQRGGLYLSPEGSQTEGGESMVTVDKGELEALTQRLSACEIRLAFMMNGTSADKLDEAERLSRGYIQGGRSAAEAVKCVLEDYPHLKLAKREVPQFSVRSEGAADGFAAIRNIFAGKK